jgi:3-oxoacyl-(acyl-carrier-protein) synthase
MNVTPDSKTAVDILGTGLLLPEPEPSEVKLPFDVEPGTCPALVCSGTIGKGVIPPAKLRRLGRTQKMAQVASYEAVSRIDIESVPPIARAICVGTGLGEAGETAKFLEHLIQTEGKEPKPARFINSVHNSIAAQVAISLDLKGENHTFSHSAISFELALRQSVLALRTGRAQLALTCGADEANEYAILAGCKYGWWGQKRNPVAPLSEAGPSNGTIPGEGAAGILLGRPGTLPNARRMARLACVRARPLPHGENGIANPEREVQFIQQSINGSGVGLSDVDLVLLGANGDGRLDGLYRQVAQALSREAGRELRLAVYKHLCGEFCTAASISLVFAVRAIDSDRVPEGIELVGGDKSRNGVRSVLLYHLSGSGYHSACLVHA